MRGKDYVAFLILIVLLLAAGAIFSSLPKGVVEKSPKSTSTSIPTSDPRLDFRQHLAHIENYSSALYGDYAPNPTVVWTGNAAGLGGTYSGSGSIKLLYDSALIGTERLNFFVGNYSVLANGTTGRTVLTKMNFSGVNSFLGSFNGTVNSRIIFQAQNGAWKIAREEWNFVTFNTSASGGATTFPEWQQVGPPIASRTSREWLHDFVWDYGGLGAAILVCAYAAEIAVLVILRFVRKKKSFINLNADVSRFH